MGETRPVLNGLFREAEKGPVLVGSHCKNCGRTHFPRVERCLDCLGTTLEDVDLPQTGKLFSFTTIHVKSANFGPGHMVGYVDLGGVRVFAPLGENGNEPHTVGERVKLEIAPLWREGEDVDVIGYRFVPENAAQEGGAAHA